MNRKFAVGRGQKYSRQIRLQNSYNNLKKNEVNQSDILYVVRDRFREG